MMHHAPYKNSINLTSPPLPLAVEVEIEILTYLQIGAESRNSQEI